MKFNKEELIKSPLNYTGGKYKLLTQILPLFPENVNTFVDLFAGGCNIGVNVQANKIICNDIEPVVINLISNWQHISSTDALEMLKQTISKYGLTKENEEGFKQIRADYNKGNKSWDMFYAMVTNAFNYQIRFNQKGEYNMPFGRNRSSFNPTLEKNFIKFIDRLNSLNIYMTNKSFVDFDFSQIGSDDLVYCDPPYLVTCASYNESDGWNEALEKDLLKLLDELDSKGVRFALSNVLENKGKSNDILKKWSEKYNVNYLNNTYSNCNYRTKDRSSDTTIEVLITNYNL